MTAKTKNSRRNNPETMQKICVYPSITQGPRPAPRNLSFPKLITGRQKNKANFKMYHIFVLAVPGWLNLSWLQINYGSYEPDFGLTTSQF